MTGDMHRSSPPGARRPHPPAAARQVDIPVTPHAIAAVLVECQRRRINPAAILGGTDVSAEDIPSPAARFNRSQEQICFRNLLRLSGDLSIGLSIGGQLHVSTLGLPGYAMLVSASLTQAVECMNRFPLLMGLYFDIRINAWPDSVVISIARYNGYQDLEAVNIDMCLAAMRVIVSDLLGKPLWPMQLQLVRGRTRDHGQYARHFRCQPVFGARENALVFQCANPSAPLLLSNQVSFNALHRQCVQMEEQWATSVGVRFAERVKALVARDFVRFGSMKTLADTLHMTERTMRRRLDKEGMSFQHLLDELRRDEAIRLLRDRELTVAEVSERLGYGDPRSFRHAFRRWTGNAPRLIDRAEDEPSE